MGAQSSQSTDRYDIAPPPIHDGFIVEYQRVGDASHAPALLSENSKTNAHTLAQQSNKAYHKYVN